MNTKGADSRSEESEQIFTQPGAARAPSPCSPITARYYTYPRSEITQLVPSAATTILDVGCGAGILGHALMERNGATVHGIEIVPHVASEAAKRLERVWCASVESVLLEIPDGTYDCIIVADVLEHLVDPLEVLRTLRTKLKRNGTIVASIPNVQNWEVISNLIEGKFEYVSEGILDRTHLRFFTRRSVCELFWKAGFHIDVLDTTRRGPIYPEQISIACRKVGLDDQSLQRDASTFQFLVRGHKPPPQNPRVAIVVLNWNGGDVTLECLLSLRNIEYPNFEIVVVDNGSTDDSVFRIRKLYPDISLIETNKNLGYAGGNNVGIQWARERSCDFILLLNNDTRVSPDYLRRLTSSAALLPPSSIIGSSMLYEDRPDTIWMLGGTWNHRTCSFDYHGANERLESHVDQLKEVDYVVGCSMFIPCAVFERIGLLDERFFLHYEEIEFCSRAAKQNIHCYVDTSAKLWHKVAFSSGGEESPLIEYFRVRNQLLWARQYLSRSEARLIRRRAWTRAKRILLPSRVSFRYLVSDPKRFYWNLAASLRMNLATTRNARSRAFLLGLRDYYLGRHGDCPAEIRSLSDSR